MTNKIHYKITITGGDNFLWKVKLTATFPKFIKYYDFVARNQVVQNMVRMKQEMLRFAGNKEDANEDILIDTQELSLNIQFKLTHFMHDQCLKKMKEAYKSHLSIVDLSTGQSW